MGIMPTEQVDQAEFQLKEMKRALKLKVIEQVIDEYLLGNFDKFLREIKKLQIKPKRRK